MFLCGRLDFADFPFRTLTKRFILKILLINPNTSEFVTQRAVEAARSVVQADTTIEGVTGTFGAQIINSETDMVIGAHSAIDLAAKFAGGFDAVGLAVSFDVGLRAIREMLTIPVAGLAQASIWRALELGHKISIISFGERTKPLYERLALQYLTEDQLAGIYCIDSLSKAELKDSRKLRQRVAEETERARQRFDCDVVILLATAFAGLKVEELVDIAVVDSVHAMLRLLEHSAIEKDLFDSITDDTCPDKKIVKGVSAELADLYLHFPSAD